MPPIDEEIAKRVSHIQGFGDGRDIFAFYEFLVAEAPPGVTICEVGNFHGRSLAYLALAAKRSGKGIRVLGADWCRGQQGFAPAGCTADSVLRSLYDLGVVEDVTLLVNRSDLAAAHVADGSLWACFVDDDHEEPLVRASCAAWFPKVAPGGIFAGHDYHWPGPNTVVKDWYKQHQVFEAEGTTNTWWFRK
jgi:hypothetical protein